MPGRIEGGTGFFCPDSAYLARKICDAISYRGMVPRIRQVQHRLQERGQPSLGRYDPNTRGRAGPAHGRVPPAQHHRGRLWGNQENVWEPPQKPQARQTEPRDSNPGHLLQHRGGRTTARKKRQAHARVAHCNGCMAGAAATAPSVGEPAHHPLDQMGFYSFGQHLKPAVCEKCHNPKNSKNACTGTTPASDCGVMSLGHSLQHSVVIYRLKRRDPQQARMRLLSRPNRRIGDTVYKTWYISLRVKTVDELGWAWG